MKTTLIEKLSRKGQYGMTTEAMILDTDTHGRLLISDGWCGDDVRGFCYRWEGGVAVQLKADDTFGTLAKPWNNYMDTLGVVLQGQDNERPMFFDWNGHAIAAIAKRHATMFNDDLYNAVQAGEINADSPVSVNVFNGPIGACGFRSGKWVVTIAGIKFKMFHSMSHRLELSEQQDSLMDTVRGRIARAIEGETYECQYTNRTQLKYPSQMERC